MPEVGTAAGKKIGKELEQGVAQGAEGAAGQVKTRLSERLGSQVGSVVGKSIGAGIKLGIAGGVAAATAGVAGIGIALTKGFDRLEAIDQAQGKLKALGHSADETKTIMENALSAVKGTAFGLQDAATAAASAVAAGIKPGQDLTKYLTEVSDAAAVAAQHGEDAGTAYNNMGSIFDKIQTQNKAYTDDLQQLSDRGVPIFTWLQQEYGVTGDKLSEMVQKGEVDSAHFQAAIEKNIGGAAVKMGDTFEGAVQNMEASVARLGANFITAALGGDPNGDTLAGPKEAIQNLTDKLDGIGKWVQAHSGEIHAFFMDMKDVAVQAASAVKSIGEFLLEHRGILEASAAVWLGWKAISATASVLSAVQGITSALGGIGPAAAAAGEAGAAGLAPLLAAAGPLAALFAGAAAFGAGLGPLLNAGPDAANQKRIDDFNRQQIENSKNNRAPAIIGPTSPVQGPGIRPSGPQTAVSPPGPVGTYDPKNPLLFPYGRATGGSIFGPGSGTSDSIPAMLSNGEHVWTADEVNKLGGQSAMYRLRGMVKAGLLKGFDGGGSVAPNLLGMLMGRSGQPDNWAKNTLFDPMQQKLLYRNMIGVDPSGLRTPGGGLFNSAMNIDTSNVSVSAPPKYGYDQWRFTWDDFTDATTYQKGERDNPSFYKQQAQLKNDPLGSWLLGYANGGAVGDDVAAAEALVGTPYSMAKRFDCSGDAARVINAALGIPGGDLMTTASASKWLSARGFKPGIGGPGSISVGWKNGGPGGGHMAMTLSDGRNAEGGGSHPNFLIGAGAAGASSAQFTNHMFLALAAAAQAPGKDASGVGQGDDNSAAPATAAGSPSGGGISVPSSLSGLSGFGLSGLGKGIGTTGSGSDLSLFGNAAASAVSGQVSSALGVFGAGDNPPFLQAASTLLGGISIGGQGGSAAPLSANSSTTGTLPPDGVHGTRAGQAPGPVFNTTISAFDTTDALRMWDNKKNQLLAAKTTAY